MSLWPKGYYRLATWRRTSGEYSYRIGIIKWDEWLWFRFNIRRAKYIGRGGTVWFKAPDYRRAGLFEEILLSMVSRQIKAKQHDAKQFPKRTEVTANRDRDYDSIGWARR